MMLEYGRCDTYISYMCDRKKNCAHPCNSVFTGIDMT